jgi:hypothetical protein
MLDPLAYPDADPTSKGLPRWLKLSAIVVAILVLLALTMLLLGGGHTPRFFHG